MVAVAASSDSSGTTRFDAHLESISGPAAQCSSSRPSMTSARTSHTHTSWITSTMKRCSSLSRLSHKGEVSESAKGDIKRMRSHLNAQTVASMRAARGLINPDDSLFMKWWDVVTTAALGYTSTVTPIEIAFFPSDSPGWEMTSTEASYARAPAWTRVALASPSRPHLACNSVRPSHLPWHGPSSVTRTRPFGI
jgi:hypothetical protein